MYLLVVDYHNVEMLPLAHDLLQSMWEALLLNRRNRREAVKEGKKKKKKLFSIKLIYKNSKKEYVKIYKLLYICL